MELVINKCFGGFGLSPVATKAYLKRKGKKAFFYKQTKWEYRDKHDEYERVDETENDMFLITVTKDFGAFTKELNNVPAGTWFWDREISRDDPDLLEVVKKLGDSASGKCAKLQVVEIPDGVKWTIEEYDGWEHVAEEHRTW